MSPVFTHVVEIVSDVAEAILRLPAQFELAACKVVNLCDSAPLAPDMTTGPVVKMPYRFVPITGLRTHKLYVFVKVATPVVVTPSICRVVANAVVPEDGVTLC